MKAIEILRNGKKLFTAGLGDGIVTAKITVLNEVDPVWLYLVALLTSASPCQAQGFVETFSGTGPYSSSSPPGESLEGFDNPGWRYNGDGMFRDGGAMA